MKQQGRRLQTHSGLLSRWTPLTLLFCASAYLAGCGSPAPRAPDAAAGAPQPAPAAAKTPAGLADFATRYGLLAETAAREERWADAVFALDVLRALRPEDAGLLRLREHAVQSAARAADTHLRLARQSKQRGDTDAATLQYLQLLALEPGHVEAADSLRSLERDRSQRGQRQRATVSAAAQRATVDAAPGSAASTVNISSAASRRTGGGRNEIEHANLLADQGEVEGAIAVLLPIVGVVGGARNDPAARSLLADLYYRQAEALLPRDPAGAIAALQRSLKTDPQNTRAAKRLRELRAQAGQAQGSPTPTSPRGKAPAR